MPFANGYTYRRAITIDHTKVPSGLTNFPVLVAGNYSWLATIANGGELANASGYDLIFTSDLAGSTPINYERVVHDLTTGNGTELWVQVPSVSSSVDTVFYAWTDNSSITTDQSNGTAVWDSDFGGVWHFKDGTTLSLADSTSHANNGTNHSATAASGQIDGAVTCDSSTPKWVDLGNDASIDIASYDSSHTSPLTVEAWIKYTATAPGVGVFPRIVSNLLFTPSFNGWELVIREHTGGSPVSNEIYFQTASGGSLYSALSGVGLVQNTVYHVVGAFDPGVSPFFLSSAAVFVNGSKSTSGTLPPYNGIGIGGNVTVGARPGPADEFDGWVDELRISKVKRSDGWVGATYNNGHSPSTFYSVGSPATAAQTITPAAAVAGPRAVPSPTISGGNLVVTPLTVGPHRAFFTPVIAGALTIPTTIGPRAIPSPTLKLAQMITLADAVLGPRSVPSPRVAHVQVITLAAAVAGPRSVPVPVVTGGPKYIAIFGVIGPRNVPVPEIIGGDLSMIVLVGGVDVSQYLSDADQSCTIASQTIGRWKATAWFEVPLGMTGWQPYVGQILQVIDYGYRIFAGCLTEVICDRRLMTENSITYKCSAADKSSICDHRVVTGATWDETYDSVQAILDICANYLNGEGVSTAQLPAIGTFGQLGAQLVGNFNTVTQMFDQIASLTGTVWWIDVDSYLWFSPLDTLGEAPFEITETSENWRNAQGYNGLIVSSSTTDYYNKLYAVSNLNILPGSGSGGTGSAGAGISQTFDWHPGSPGIRTAKDAAGNDVAAGIVVGNPIASITNLTVNGVPQTYVDFGAYNGQEPSPPDLLWFFTGPATGSPGPGVSPVALPSDHAVIAITYVPSLSTASSNPQYGNALKPIDVHGTRFGTCGSGVYEGVVTVQNISDQASLNAIAAAELDRIGDVPTTVQYETDYPGLRPGQAQFVTLPLSGIADREKFLITSVQGVRISPTLPFGGSFRWQVEGRSNLDPGNWLKWYERLIERTLNPLPVLQFEAATFVLGTGGSLSSGVSLTNPYIVGRTGQVIEILAAASVGPVGQDLILTITVNGLPTMQIVMPAGTAANQLITQEIPKSLGLYVFSRQVLNISAQYVGVGGATSKAAGVTVSVRWAM